MKKMWDGQGGCRDVLRLAFPLILSTSSSTIQMFVDRMFLMWHSSEAMSAAMPAGITSFIFVSFFMGTAGYVNTFVAQYTGAGRDSRVGPAVWQGIYFSLFAGVLAVFLIPCAKSIFGWFGHDPVVQQYEVIYFRIMCMGIAPCLIATTVSCFFTGRGKTWVIFYVNVTATIVNIILDYCLIFDHIGPAGWQIAGGGMGIAGAAYATVIANCVSAVGFSILFFGRKNRRKFATLSGAKLDFGLFGRLMRFGLPNGVQFMLDIMAFALFVNIVGGIDKISLAATTITFQLNMLAFLPMIGFGIALTTLVGQSLGKNKPEIAKRSTWSAFYMTFTYMSLIAVGFWFLPDMFLYPFEAGVRTENIEEFMAIKSIAKTLLCFVSFYCLFDAGNIIFSATLKGAGDTRFVMLLSVCLSWTTMVMPTYLAIKNQWGPCGGLYLAWGFTTGYVCILAAAFFIRFMHGKWKSMRVIEPIPTTVPRTLPEVPTVELDAN